MCTRPSMSPANRFPRPLYLRTNNLATTVLVVMDLFDINQNLKSLTFTNVVGVVVNAIVVCQPTNCIEEYNVRIPFFS